MTATVLPNGVNQYFDNNGNPLSGGTVETYAAGTSTPKTTWSDAAQTAPNANPTVLDSAGRATLFWSGAYKIIVKDSGGAVITSIDGVQDRAEIVATDLLAYEASIAASTGSNIVGFIQAGSGAVARTAQAKMRLWVDVLDFGADPTGAADSYTAFQNATNAVQTNPLGGTVFIPAGTYTISGGTVTNDRSANSALGRVSYVGQSENATRITYTGAPANCFYLANNQTAAGEQNASYQTISDMTILGPSLRANSCGIVLNLGAFPKFERLDIQGFDYGMYLQDVDHAYFEKVNARFNSQGIFARKNPAPGATSTQPNNFTFVSCSLSNNGSYGAYIVGGAAINMFGGDVEANGATIGATGFGVKLQDCGYEGGRGANFQGVYFESNNGTADVILQATTAPATPMLGVVHTIASEFHRVNAVNPNTNHILCAFGADATVGKQQLVLVGSSFKSFGTYSPSAGTPVISYSVTAASISNFYDFGSYYMNAVEKPAFVQNVNKKEIVVTKTAAQTFTTAVSAKWLLDTVVSPNPLWSPTVTSGNVTIDETGTYSISAFAILSTSASGQKLLTFLKNGTIFGSGEANSATNVVGATVMQRFTAGDVLTINYLQSTGANQDINGGGGGTTAVTIAKVF
jgi:Pectate lyase superfamily protein